MTIIGQEELGEFDERLRKLLSGLAQATKVSDADHTACRAFLCWVIYSDWDSEDELDVRPIEYSDSLGQEERQALIEVSRLAAILVKKSKKRDKSNLVEACKTLMHLRGVEFGAPQNDQAGRLDKRTEARNKFVYEKLYRGRPAGQVLNLVGQHPDWEIISGEVELLECATDFARRNNLPLPPGV